MFDSMSGNNGKPWNVTFFDYNAHTMDKEISEKYEFIHVTSSSTGKIVTMNRKSGEFLWEKLDIKSPIVSIFILGRDGLLSVPFTTVAEDVVSKVTDFSKSNGINDFQLYETVFVGEGKGSSISGDTLYALPAFVDDSTPTIKKNAFNLLEGPKSNRDSKIESKKPNKKQKTNYIIFGHYENPTVEEVIDTIAKDGNKAMTVRNDRNVFLEDIDSKGNKVILPSDNRPEKNMKSGNMSKVIKNDEIAETPKNSKTMLKKLFTAFKFWFDNEENKILKLLMLILIGSFIMMVFYFRSTMRELRQSQNGSRTKIPRSGDSTDSYTIVESINGGEQFVNRDCN
jgi:serine/threonine-protein kinase/endoribonuclease IRE1